MSDKKFVSLKTPEQIQIMRDGGKILQAAQEAVKKILVPGVSLLELDRVAEEAILERNGIPAFKGFHGFPNSICTMVNSEVVHGIPDQRVLNAGDLISIDCGVIYKDLITDAAFTSIVGGDEANLKRAQFSNVVYQALQAGCAMAKTGNTLGDIGHAIESVIKKNNYSVIDEYTGHGVGEEMHMNPYVYNYGKPGKGLKLKTGMTLCIEPIIAQGKPGNKTLKDGWTVVTLDGKDACQWEHCGVVTPDGFEIFA